MGPIQRGEIAGRGVTGQVLKPLVCLSLLCTSHKRPRGPWRSWHFQDPGCGEGDGAGGPGRSCSPGNRCTGLAASRAPALCGSGCGERGRFGLRVRQAICKEPQWLLLVTQLRALLLWAPSFLSPPVSQLPLVALDRGKQELAVLVLRTKSLSGLWSRSCIMSLRHQGPHGSRPFYRWGK